MSPARQRPNWEKPELGAPEAAIRFAAKHLTKDDSPFKGAEQAYSFLHTAIEKARLTIVQESYGWHEKEEWLSELGVVIVEISEDSQNEGNSLLQLFTTSIMSAERLHGADASYEHWTSEAAKLLIRYVKRKSDTVRRMEKRRFASHTEYGERVQQTIHGLVSHDRGHAMVETIKSQISQFDQAILQELLFNPEENWEVAFAQQHNTTVGAVKIRVSRLRHKAEELLGVNG